MKLKEYREKLAASLKDMENDEMTVEKMNAISRNANVMCNIIRTEMKFRETANEKINTEVMPDII